MSLPAPLRFGWSIGTTSLFRITVIVGSFIAFLAPCGAEEPGVSESDVFNEADEDAGAARKRSRAEEADDGHGSPAEDAGDESPQAEGESDDRTSGEDPPPKRLPVPAKAAIADAEKAI